MNRPGGQPRQPGQAEIQQIINLIGGGRLPQAEEAARALVRACPNALVAHNLLGVAFEQQGKFEQAATAYGNALAIDPDIAEIRFNLGVVLGNLGKTEEAAAQYRKAIARKPDLAVAHFNLGTLLQAQGKLAEAADCHRRATQAEPRFVEAWGNLGAVLQQQGWLDDAIAAYRSALRMQPDAQLHFNLGTALRTQGRLEEAAASFRDAIALRPDYAQAHNNLGETLRDQGRMGDAVQCYRTALEIDPDNAEACYNMGEYLYFAGEFDKAVEYFERSPRWDSRDRALYCLYKAGRFDAFAERLETALAGPHTSPLLATLTTHYATNFGVEDRNGFCRNPMDFVHHSRIDALAAPGSPLLADLLRDITHTEIAERKQGRLYYGIQSAGNLLKRPEPSFQALAAAVREKIAEYRARFADAGCELVRAFPEQIEFSSSWYLKMQKGGHLTSHIHEEGWISGCVYLALPDKNQGHAGSIEFSTHGDDYPQRHADFPSRIVDQAVGDIVLFPSSLFHRTIPFESDEDRVCVAFDLKPANA